MDQLEVEQEDEFPYSVTMLCCNAMVCGGIQVGNDILIAADSFVNFDVPDHSIAIGNPEIIKRKEKASADYYGIFVEEK